MKRQLQRLNSKQVKLLHKQLQEQFAIEEKLDYLFFQNENKKKIYLISKEFDSLDTEHLRIDTMGLYFGAFVENQFRLSIDGAQLLAPLCKKGIIDIDKKQMQAWLQGEKLEIADFEGVDLPPVGNFVIMRFGEDILGCGKVTAECISNYIPKTRYIHALYD
jgi:NOL1/NOP2/fmu family ribosome biogenesis protein